MDKATGEPYLVDGKTVTAQMSFTPEAEEGSVSLKFAFDGTGLKNVTLVVYETLYRDDSEVASHKDLDDEGQTVKYPDLSIETTAKDKASGTHEGKAAKSVTIIDTVSYSGLIVGHEYTISGVLMDKATGDPYLVDGNRVTAQQTFVPSSPDGTVDMEFTFDGSELAGKEIVVFEGLYYDNVEVAVHADIEDSAQTVKFIKPESVTPVSMAPQTGLNTPNAGIFAGAGMLLIAAGIFFMRRKRTN